MVGAFLALANRSPIEMELIFSTFGSKRSIMIAVPSGASDFTRTCSCCLSPIFNSVLSGFNPTSIIEGAGSDALAAIALTSGFGATSITGAGAVSCFAVRLVDATFVGDDTKFLRALATSAVGDATSLAFTAPDLGCGIAASGCSAAAVRFVADALAATN